MTATLRTALIVALLAATLLASWSADHRPPEPLAYPLETIPAPIGDWTGADNPPLSSAVLKELVATGYLSRTYRQGGKSLGLFVAYYAQQRAGENMHSPKNCLPGAGWEMMEHGFIDIPVDGGQVQVNKYLVRNGSERSLVIYWYQSKRRIIARELQGKLLLVRDAVFENRTGGSLVRLTLSDQAGALDDGVAFASKVIPLVHHCLGG